MLQRLRSRFNREEGFTLIELLVVILIIGILAAIAIPSFLNQRGKGEDASAKSAARMAQTAIETASTDRGDYNIGNDAAGVGVLQAIESQVPDFGTTEGTITALTTSATAWTVTVESSEGRTFTIDRAADGTVERECAVPASASDGGCQNVAAGAGDW